MATKEEKAERKAQRAAEKAERKGQRDAGKAERKAQRDATTDFTHLGVAVLDGQVYKSGFWTLTGKPPQNCLGELAGARAEVVAGTIGHRRSGGRRTTDAALATAVLGPVGLLAGVSRQQRRPENGTAFVIFANGTTYEQKLTSAEVLLRAEADAVRFSALADSAEGR